MKTNQKLIDVLNLVERGQISAQQGADLLSANKPKLGRIKIVSFRLTMPNRGSWNGQWSGQEKLYYVIRKTHAEKFLLNGETKNDFHYSWNDGWGANVECEVVDSKEAAKRRKISSGFCGYEWMVDNIIDHGSPYKVEKEVLV